MVRREQSSSDLRETGSTSAGVGALPTLEALRQQFGEFRRSQPPRTRVPASLRRAALAAMGEGAGRTDVRRACGVTSKQLDAWQRGQEAGPSHANGSGELDAARVFSVLSGPAAPVESRNESPLEFRLNGWSITLRRVAGGIE